LSVAVAVTSRETDMACLSMSLHALRGDGAIQRDVSPIAN
jgi:hypothetical protein